MTKNMISTDLSRLVSVLKEKNEIKLTEAALMLELSEHETETLTKKLAEYGILEMRYSLKGHKTLRIGSKMTENEEPEKGSHKKHPVSAETEKAFNIMRHKIAEKKGFTIQKTHNIQETENNRTDTDHERHKRLNEIREGLIAVRENLEKIRINIETDLTNRHESYNAQTGAELIRAK
ncbi:MAG: hypothetical protein WAX07_06075 [Candidatus Altiarchaeia archaeon]